MADDIYFQAHAVNGLMVRTTQAYWQRIITHKHPVMKGKEEDVKLALQDPEELRQSKQNQKVLLYYRKANQHHTCVVVRLTNGEGFIVTTYLTDKIKEGDRIWKK